MSQYKATIDAFDEAYRLGIIAYAKDHMTPRERKVFKFLVDQIGIDSNKHGKELDLDKIIDQCRSVDPEGWMVYKCCFVEDYMNKLAQDVATNGIVQVQCLCEIDDMASSGLVIYSGISRAHYTRCMMHYQLTSLEYLKVDAKHNSNKVSHVSTDTADLSGDSCVFTVQAVDARKRLLQFVSGCDSMGWLAHKHRFIQEELATRDEMEISQHEQRPHLEGVLSSAIIESLNNTRVTLGNEIRQHYGITSIDWKRTQRVIADNHLHAFGTVDEEVGAGNGD